LSYVVYGGARDWLPERIGTFSVWFYPIKRVGGSYQTIFRYDGGTGYLLLRINDSGDTVASYWGTTSSNTSNTVTYDTWNHLAMTINGSTKIMYLNGVKTTGSVGSNLAYSASSNASVGYSAASDQFMGYIDDLFIMPYVLSDQEVQQLYQSNLPANIASGSGELKLSSATTQAAIIGSSQGIVAYGDTGAESFALANESFNWGAQYAPLAAGDLVLGDPDARHLFYDASAGTLQFKTNTTVLAALSSTAFTIGDTTKNNVAVTATTLKINYNGTDKIAMDASGNLSLAGALAVGATITVGSAGALVTTGVTYGSGTGVFLGYDSTLYKFRVGTTAGNRFVWDGADIEWYGVNTSLTKAGVFTASNVNITAGAGSVRLTASGLRMDADAWSVSYPSSPTATKTIRWLDDNVSPASDIAGDYATSGGASNRVGAIRLIAYKNSSVGAELSRNELRIDSASSGLTYITGGVSYKVWHAENDGTGSALDADLLDGIHATGFLRRDADNVGTDTDLYFGLGKAKIGYAGFADSATFAHVDQHTTTGYALSQTAAGDTFINAKTGNKIYLRNNDNSVLNVDNSGINMGTGKYVDSLVAYKRNSTDGYLFVPINPITLTDGTRNWDGTQTALATGNYDFNIRSGQTTNYTDTAIKGVLVSVSSQFGASGEVTVYDLLNSKATLKISSHVSNRGTAGVSYVNLNSSGVFRVIIESGTANYYVCRLLGYFI
jgi:hypothetical protein